MNDVKMYVVLPAFSKSGGPELGHQLVYLYNKNGINATIAYLDSGKYENPVNPEFSVYVNKWIAFENIPDEENIRVILPETCISLLKKFKKAKRYIWWMSVDNSYADIFSFKTIKSFGWCWALKQLCHGHIGFTRTIKSADGHFYQSEYARLFLQKKGLTNLYPLSDYINDSFFEKPFNIAAKEDIVLYNPAKGYKFTKKLIEKKPQLKWVALKNLTTAQVVDLLNKGKVYIDFGHHPGKDRFPREAAISGCCIITGKRGSAGNGIDIEISEKYKFDESEKNIDEILALIEDCLVNYENRVADFSEYRFKISHEKEIFYKEALDIVKHIF
ncbi:MAG: hypothetical protein IJQ23_01320 [Clostridia bacterium]|nr:hypothetical protein [Clostridia bacterium]